MASTPNVSNLSEKAGYPTITVLEVSEEKPSPERLQGSCCICFPERVGVAAIFSLHFFFGLFNAIGSFVALTFYQDVESRAFFIVTGVLFTFMNIAGVIGIVALRKENAVLMRRLSIAFWILAIITFIFNVSMYILEIVEKDSWISDCQQLKEESIANGSTNSDWDCEYFFKILLVRDAIKLFVINAFMFYFTFVIHRYARRMIIENAISYPFGNRSDDDGQRTPTYPVYVTRPPTSLDWIPPPTYTVRASNPTPVNSEDDHNTSS